MLSSPIAALPIVVRPPVDRDFVGRFADVPSHDAAGPPNTPLRS
jgi:hypothetical protein